MFAQTLYVQWKWNRDFLAFFTLVAFVAPLIILWIAMTHVGVSTARELVIVGGVIGVTAGVVAVLAGVTLAWQGYGVDERAGHTYALSLPVTRLRALGMRAGAAGLLLVIPAVGVWIGAMTASAQAKLPPTLESYAGSLAVRALLASWLAHACMFGLRYAAGRRAKAVLAGLIILGGTLAFLSASAPALHDPIVRLGRFLVDGPGPLGILAGRWTLIDV